MKYRFLGSTGIKMSEIGLGCASYWGKQSFPEEEAIRIVHAAIDEGITFFDTGHGYSGGNAEIRLGKALRNVPTKSELCISTKAGTRIGNNGRFYKDFSPKWIRDCCLKSLNILGLDVLPMFQLHGPNTDDIGNLIAELQKMKKEGLIESFGINTFDDFVIKTIIDKFYVDFVMLDYNIMTQNREPLIDQLLSKGIACIAGAPLAESLYSNRIFQIKGMKDLWYFGRAMHRFRSKMVKGIHFRFVNHAEGLTGAQVSLAYVLFNKKISSAVFGTTSEVHLRENIRASDMVLDDWLIQKIKSADKSRFWFENA